MAKRKNAVASALDKAFAVISNGGLGKGFMDGDGETLPKPKKPVSPEEQAKRSKKGASSRRKGHDFERDRATVFRGLYPEAASSIIRAEQGRGATGADIEGVPDLWVECQHAEPENWTPVAKLEQSERDEGRARARGQPPLLSIAITKVTGAGPKGVQVTLRLSKLLDMLAAVDAANPEHELDELPVALPWDGFIAALKAAQAAGWKPR